MRASSSGALPLLHVLRVQRGDQIELIALLLDGQLRVADVGDELVHLRVWLSM